MDNTKDDKSDKDYKVRFLINHFNQIFSDSVSNDDSQSIDKHLIEFRDRSSMKQYVKTNQSNGFSSFGIVVLVKQDTSINYTCTWVKKRGRKSRTRCCFKNDRSSHCIFFDIVFNSHSLVRLYERGLYCIGTVRKDRKGIPEMPVDRQTMRADFKYLYSDKVACCKWFDRHSITLLFSNAEGLATTSTVPRRQKGSVSKIQVPCSDVIKM